jgi:hypothetical protein
MAHSGPEAVDRAGPLCPLSSDVNLLRYCKRIVYFNT